MMSLKKYFVSGNSFEAEDSETGEVVDVSMDRFVRGTVAGYIFSDEEFNVELSSAKITCGDDVITGHIADCNIIDVVSEEGVVKRLRVYVVFVAPDDNLKSFIFTCPEDTNIQDIISQTEEALSRC